MQIRRARSALALRHIKDQVLETGEMNKDVFLSILAGRLQDEKADEHTFIVVGIDDSDKNKVIGHLIAIAEPFVEYIWIYEAVYSEKIGVEKAVEVTQKCRNAVISWANLLNRPAIRMQTKRNIEAWERKWGMKPLATVMELRLDTVLNDQIFEELKESENSQENENGRRKLDNQRVGTDGRPAASDLANHESAQRDSAESDDEHNRTGDSSVHRTTSREDSSGNGSTGVSREDSSPDSNVSDVHERYLSSIERASGV